MRNVTKTSVLKKLFDPELSDEMILKQVVAGNKEIFRLLVEKHECAVKSLGYSFFHNSEETTDFVQEVFIKVFKSAAGFNYGCRFSTWLYRIAYTTALNKINRTKEYVSLADNDYENAPQDCPWVSNINQRTPEDLHIRQAIKEAVRQAVSELPEKFRVCIDLFFFYERSYEEIERITGMPVNTIKSHVFRAKKLLREKLKVFVEAS
ncbi:MAG: sigma-70 family RNA polymerase sigma factor [Termitinemataceae bacterium]|nr:MAG: sigma-70 family RNA polymerase sigma factor [Termitinemataceae bacterium]